VKRVELLLPIVMGIIVVAIVGIFLTLLAEGLVETGRRKKTCPRNRGAEDSSASGT
jgi:hypothetical protein